MPVLVVVGMVVVVVVTVPPPAAHCRHSTRMVRTFELARMLLWIRGSGARACTDNSDRSLEELCRRRGLGGDAIDTRGAGFAPGRRHHCELVDRHHGGGDRRDLG